jgi:hypothetical protein
MDIEMRESFNETIIALEQMDNKITPIMEPAKAQASSPRSVNSRPVIIGSAALS